jgi:hypothetical protein
MNWEMVSAIVATVVFLFTLFIEWPRFKARLTESRSAVSTVFGKLLDIAFIGLVLAAFSPPFIFLLGALISSDDLELVAQIGGAFSLLWMGTVVLTYGLDHKVYWQIGIGIFLILLAVPYSLQLAVRLSTMPP